MVLAVGLGPVTVSPATVLKILAGKIFGVASAWDAVEENIVWGLRLPRVLLGFVVGASLSVCGVAMQALVRNSLADPFILGVSSGASAAATLGMIFGAFSFLGTYSLPLSAFIGAGITILIVYTLSRVRGRVNITQLLLSGVAVAMVMDAFTNVIVLSAPNALGLHNASF
jgi:iron complex transport system permease protein